MDEHYSYIDALASHQKNSIEKGQTSTDEQESTFFPLSKEDNPSPKTTQTLLGYLDPYKVDSFIHDTHTNKPKKFIEAKSPEQEQGRFRVLSWLQEKIGAQTTKILESLGKKTGTPLEITEETTPAEKQELNPDISNTEIQVEDLEEIGKKIDEIHRSEAGILIRIQKCEEKIASRGIIEKTRYRLQQDPDQKKLAELYKILKNIESERDTLRETYEQISIAHEKQNQKSDTAHTKTTDITSKKETTEPEKSTDEIAKHIQQEKKRVLEGQTTPNEFARRLVSLASQSENYALNSKTLYQKTREENTPTEIQQSLAITGTDDEELLKQVIETKGMWPQVTKAIVLSNPTNPRIMQTALEHSWQFNNQHNESPEQRQDLILNIIEEAKKQKLDTLVEQLKKTFSQVLQRQQPYQKQEQQDIEPQRENTEALEQSKPLLDNDLTELTPIKEPQTTILDNNSIELTTVNEEFETIKAIQPILGKLIKLDNQFARLRLHQNRQIDENTLSALENLVSKHRKQSDEYDTASELKGSMSRIFRNILPPKDVRQSKQILDILSSQIEKSLGKSGKMVLNNLDKSYALGNKTVLNQDLQQGGWHIEQNPKKRAERNMRRIIRRTERSQKLAGRTNTKNTGAGTITGKGSAENSNLF